MSDIPQLLHALEQGDPHAADQLLPLVYGELRRLAAQKLAQEPPGQTFDATDLVHEAFLRLIASGGNKSAEGAKKILWDSPGHFFAAAAEAMRRILIDNARRKHALKRGGHRVRQRLDSLALGAAEDYENVLMVDEALTKLAGIEPQVAQLVKLRYFAGLTIPQVADALGVSPRTADAWWAYVRAWMRVELSDAPSESEPEA